jgi:hypothetical protein
MSHINKKRRIAQIELNDLLYLQKICLRMTKLIQQTFSWDDFCASKIKWCAIVNANMESFSSLHHMVVTYIKTYYKSHDIESDIVNYEYKDMTAEKRCRNIRRINKYWNKLLPTYSSQIETLFNVDKDNDRHFSSGYWTYCLNYAFFVTRKDEWSDYYTNIINTK